MSVACAIVGYHPIAAWTRLLYAVQMKIHNLISLPVVALVALFGLPASGSAQTILLTADSFAVLAGTAVTSTGTVGTVITNGNVGANAGISGFPPGVITPPSMEILGGPVVGQALIDLNTAQVGLAGMPSNTTLTNVDMGGLTLIPGVYTFAAQASQTGALTLNAQGKNNVFWVFQIGTSLTTSLGSTVNIINPGTNGGSDDGVFWDAETGGITIGASSTMLGNYLAHTSITYSGTTNASGGVRSLAEAGVTLDQNIVNPMGGPGGSGYTGGLKYNQSGAVVPIPEPAAFLWLAPLGAFGLVLWRRRGRGVVNGPAANVCGV